MRWKPIAQFVYQLELETHYRIEANLYYTPMNATAFPPHYDLHDVFVVQLFGEKQWQFFNSRIKLPERRFDRHNPELIKDTNSPIRSELLKTGDILFMPRGLVHGAATNTAESLHLSIGFYPVLWKDLVFNAVQLESETSIQFRSSVHPEYLKKPETLMVPKEVKEALNNLPNLFKKVIMTKN